MEIKIVSKSNSYVINGVQVEKGQDILLDYMEIYKSSAYLYQVWGFKNKGG